MRSVQLKPALLLLLIALALAACGSKRVVKEPEEASTGPTIYGTISVSVDQVTTR
jgi:predicted small lipoprotein YifL